MVLNVGATQNDRNFVWYTESEDSSQVRLYPQGDEAAAQYLDATDTGTSLDMPGLTWHHASVVGLEPGTTYLWQTGSDELGWSEAYEFNVQSDDELDVLVFGDTQIGSGGGDPSDGAAWQNTLDTALAQVKDPDFLLSVGDQVNTHDSASEYIDYLAPDQLRENALATNIGNHDDGSASDAQHSYSEHFNMPNRTANPGWNNEMGNYWYIQNNTLFVSLNSNERDTEAHEQWLREVVAAHGQDVDWKIATWHHSLYSTASHATDGDIEERREWMPPLMSELDFDVVMSGHDHVYNRSHLLNAGHPVGDLSAPEELMKYEDEVLYLTHQSSSGSKYYEIQSGPNFTFNAVESQNRTPAYSHLEIDGGRLNVTTYQVNGETIDSLSLTKAPEGAEKPAENEIPDEPAQTVFRNEGPLTYDDPVETIFREDTGDYLAEGRILNAYDDVEEGLSNGGALDMTSSDLELVHESPGSQDTNPQHVGMRFSLLDIPAGAEITGAYVQFTVDEPDKTGDPFNVRIHAESTGHAEEYDEFEAHNVSSREYFDTAVDWSDAPVWTAAQEAGEDQRTPDISELIQAVVDRDDWQAGNSLALMLDGEGTRTAESYNGGGSDQAPKLMVTYTVPEDGSDEGSKPGTPGSEQSERARERGADQSERGADKSKPGPERGADQSERARERGANQSERGADPRG
ncbi:metallophosphoesterase [Brevibacterium daeguense]|nr:metallophosphoesterase [Brevibacterium daeguense]